MRNKVSDTERLAFDKLTSLRVLTIKQPWAGSIFTLGKDVENRSWATNYRGLIVVHAGKSLDASFMKSQFSHQRVASPYDERSAILGVVELVECVQNHQSRWADEGKYHWVLRNPTKLKRPISGVNGSLGLWRLDDKLLNLLQTKLKR